MATPTLLSEMYREFSRNGIVPAAAPGMATGDAPDREPETFEESVFFQRLGGIMRTGGCEPAFRSQPGGNDPLVDLYQEDKGQAKYLQYLFHGAY